MTTLTPGTHVEFDNPLTGTTHRGVVTVALDPDNIEVVGYSGRIVTGLRGSSLTPVAAPAGTLNVGDRVIGIEAFGLASRYSIGLLINATDAQAKVYDERHFNLERFPASTLFPVPQAAPYAPRVGDRVVARVPDEGFAFRLDGVAAPDSGAADVHLSRGVVVRVLVNAKAVVDSEDGTITVHPSRLSADPTVEPGTWVVLPDGTTGSVLTRDQHRRHTTGRAWGYNYTVAVPGERNLSFEVWAGAEFDGFVLADAASGSIAGRRVRT